VHSLSFCLITTFYPPYSFGGDAVHVHRLATGLAERGYRVRVVHSPAAHRLLARGRSPATGEYDHPGVEVVAAPVGAVATTGTYLTGLPLGYRRRLGELAEGFDVVHFHNPSLLAGPGGLAVGSRLRLYTTHEHWLLCPTHVLFRYGREVCTRRTCWRCTASYHRPPQLWRSTPMLRRGLQHIHAVLSPSRFTAALHRQEFAGAHIEVLPLPGPPGAALAVARAPAPGPRPFFLYAGRLEPIKGVDRLLGAFACVRGADLVIAGDGALTGNLRQQATGNPSVHFIGRLPHHEALALSRSALAVVVPSVGYETFGGAAADAMAVGTPAVVRDLGPLPELVEDGGGLVFADDCDLTRVLQGLVDDPHLVERLGDEAARVAADRFGEERFFLRYLQIVAERAAHAGLGEVSKRAVAALAGSR
jgi:glycosyltransferase involved in cell wall biosynthesis